jgi:hypothetical protein
MLDYGYSNAAWPSLGQEMEISKIWYEIPLLHSKMLGDLRQQDCAGGFLTAGTYYKSNLISV